MKKNILIAAVVLLFTMLLAQNAYCGAWTVPKYNVWLEYYENAHWATSDYNNKWSVEDKNNGGKSWGWTADPSLEFGVTDWFTALASFEYKDDKYKEYDRPDSWGPFARKNNGVTVYRYGGRLRLMEKPVVLSTQLKVSMYAGYGIDHGDDPAYQHEPAIGHGEDSYDWRMLVGKEFTLDLTKLQLNPVLPFPHLDCYVGAEAGYRLRNRHVCSDVPLFFEGGFWLTKWLLVKGELDSYFAIPGTGSIDTSYGIGRVGVNFQTLPRGDPIRKKGKQFNIEVLYGKVLFGKNISDDQEVVVKLQTLF